VPVLLARVDDRLIHGQVVHGWARPLDADLFAIVSDELRADPERAELYLLAVPEGAEGRALSVAEALGPEFRSAAEAARTILLFADLATALRLAEGGFPLESLNIGGLHHASGKHQVLPYVFLDSGDRDALRRLAGLGVRVGAQDLPGNAAHELTALMGTE
jgi:mannose/fructose/N-acetylgalactosamine-specific phosphotransferase system component IIB